jgi:hypothetical protein
MKFIYLILKSSFYRTVDRLCAPHEVQLVNAGGGKQVLFIGRMVLNPYKQQG